MAIAGCGLILDGPVPKLTRFGLLSSLDGLQNPADPHWQAGLQVEEVYCSSLNSTLPSCPAPSPAKQADGGPSYCCSEPFTIYSSFKCPPVGYSLQRAYEIAQKRYDANVEQALEKIFWTGITDAGPIEPSLANGNNTCGLTVVDLTPAAGAVNALASIAAIEQAMATCWPGQSLIHMNAGVLPFVADRARLVDTGESLFTYGGNRVIAGHGYPTSGPANIAAPPGEAWIFGTSQVQGWRSDPFFTPPKGDEVTAVDRNINDVTVRLETTWAFAFTCCIYAIRTKLSGCDCC